MGPEVQETPQSRLRNQASDPAVCVVREYFEGLLDDYKEKLVRNNDDQVRGRAKLCQEFLNIFA